MKVAAADFDLEEVQVQFSIDDDDHTKSDEQHRQIVITSGDGGIDDHNEEVIIHIREYDEEKDREAVEEMERQSDEADGEEGKASLVTHLLGDPLGRVRQCPTRIMMVAEVTTGSEQIMEIAGVIRGCVKTVTSGQTIGEFPVYTKVVYVLGLRVSPNHRRCGIATKLVNCLEQWSKSKGAEYAYMATDSNNFASIELFTRKCNYTRFRSPTILVQPVHTGHSKHISSSITIIKLSPPLAGSFYRTIFTNSEFFPKDIDSVLSNPLNLGTFIALPKRNLAKWDPSSTSVNLPECFAMVSVWKTTDVYKFQVEGAKKMTRVWCKGSRVFDKLFSWMKLPSIPDFFKPFGYYFLYGIHMEGSGCLRLMRSLCHMAHNMARSEVGCGVVVAEVAQGDLVTQGIPHWKRFSWDEDVWCMKKLVDDRDDDEDNDGDCDRELGFDWSKSKPSSSSSVIFVDPRDL